MYVVLATFVDGLEEQFRQVLQPKREVLQVSSSSNQLAPVQEPFFQTGISNFAFVSLKNTYISYNWPRVKTTLQIFIYTQFT